VTKEAFHVLLALADSDRHGYGIIQDVSAATGGALALRTGTLYNILKRLLEEGWIAESDARPARDDDERRRYYRLTPQGRRELQAEAQRLEQVVDLARARRMLPKSARGGGR
jgi:DNA-binding PadR family transcriptional regulator